MVQLLAQHPEAVGILLAIAEGLEPLGAEEQAEGGGDGDPGLCKGRATRAAGGEGQRG